MFLEFDEKIVESAYCKLFREDTPTAPGDIPVPTFNVTAHAIKMDRRRANL
jgi:hypothetical protein